MLKTRYLKNIILLFFAILCFSGCSNNHITDDSGFTSIGRNEKSRTQPQFDTLKLDVENSSGQYFLKLFGEKIFYIDKLFGTIKEFDKNGNL